MKKFIILLLMSLMLYASNSKAQGCLQADMMILVDWSGSEQGNEEILAMAAMMFVSELPVDENQLRIGLITFSQGIDDIVELTGDKELLMEEIAATALIGAAGGTYTEEALLVAGKYLVNERQVPKIIIIISDGGIYDMKQSTITAMMLKTSLPAAIFAVQIGGTEDEYKNLIKLTGTPNNVEKTVPAEILEALKKLNICG